MPSRNPLPLSASQEAQVREIFNARVREKCADDIKGMFWTPPPQDHGMSRSYDTPVVTLLKTFFL